MKFTQTNRKISFSTPLGEDVLLFHTMHGSEQLGTLFEYQLELLSETKKIPFSEIIGKNTSIKIKLDNGLNREFNGIVTSFSFVGSYGDLFKYHATVRPWTWLLTRSTDCCIFQNKTVIEIVTEICEKNVYAGYTKLDKKSISKTYPKLEYCVQYRETDFDFICRILNHSGIYFFFNHKDGAHVMSLIDHSFSHQPYPAYEKIQFSGDDQRNSYGDERITAFVVGGEIQASGYALNDFESARQSQANQLN
jgi:type VI secretion system secreted protein VgrG